jgi:hypothetical protein
MHMKNTPVSRKISKWALAFVAAFAIGAAVAAAPGPTSSGEFYYYLDAAGKVIGYRAIDCNGNPVGWGKTSYRYLNGYQFCDPIAN